MVDPLPNLDDQIPDEVLPAPFHAWPEAGFRPGACLRAGAVLGGMAGSFSLLVNVIGSVAWSTVGGHVQHPLRLIQVYLTFPLGESALELSSGALLAGGCLLYLATGVIYGVFAEFVVAYFFPHAGFRSRLVIFSLLLLSIWVINFYGLLIWLQPLLFGGRWIVTLIPWWVAAVTHLVFGWTMALIHSWNGGQEGGLPGVDARKV